MPARGDNLHLAASRGKTYRVAACLANDEDPNGLDAHRRTPLTISIKRGHLEVVKALLRAGAQVNLPTPEGTPLEVLLQQSRPSSAVVREIVLAGADLGRPDPKGYLPVQRAAVNGQTSALRELLSNSSSGRGGGNLPRLDLDATVADSGKTAMCLAARKGHVEVVQMLLWAGASPSVADKRSWTPLHFAAWKGHLRVVWELLGAGVDCSPLSDNHWTPLLAASVGGHSEVVRQLIGAGASVTERTSNGWNALHMASQAGHIDVVRALLVAGARPGDVAEKGWTALMAAAAEGHGKIVRELLLLLACQEEHGAPHARGGEAGEGRGVVNARNNKGCTALIMAARNGFADVVRDLLEAGADTTPSIAGGWTALATACAGGHDRAAGYLLRAGADPDQRDGLGRTLLHDAAEDCRWDVVRELLRAGADPDAVTDAGETPLSLAGLGGSFEVIRELLQAGAEPLAVGPKAATTPKSATTTAASGPSVAGGSSPVTTASSVRSSISSSTSSNDKWRDYRFKAEKAASGLHQPREALSPSSAAAASAPVLLELGAKQGKQHPLLLELRRNTAPPEFPGSVRTPLIKGPSLRRSEMPVTANNTNISGGYAFAGILLLFGTTPLRYAGTAIGAIHHTPENVSSSTAGPLAAGHDIKDEGDLSAEAMPAEAARSAREGSDNGGTQPAWPAKKPNEGRTSGGSVGVRVDTGVRSPHYGDVQERHRAWLIRKAQQLSLRLDNDADRIVDGEKPNTTHREDEGSTAAAAGNDGGSTTPFSSLEANSKATGVGSDGRGSEVERKTRDEGEGGRSSLRGVAAAAAAAAQAEVEERIYRLNTGTRLWEETYVPPIEPARRRDLIDKWTGATWSPPENAARKSEEGRGIGTNTPRTDGRILYVISSFDRGQRLGKKYADKLDKMDFVLMMLDEMREACEVGFSPEVHLLAAWDPSVMIPFAQDRLFCERTGQNVPFSFQEYPHSVGNMLSVKVEDDMMLTLNHILNYQEESELLDNRIASASKQKENNFVPGFIRVEPGTGEGSGEGGEVELYGDDLSDTWVEWEIILSRFFPTKVKGAGTYLTLRKSMAASFGGEYGGNNQGLWMATREQLRKLNERKRCRYLNFDEDMSVGKPEIHSGSFQMFSRDCGFDKVFPATHFEDFLVHHRANNKAGRRGESIPGVPIRMLREWVEQFIRDEGLLTPQS
eukprot:g2087.t1